jgi:hypothetical protein
MILGEGSGIFEQESVFWGFWTLRTFSTTKSFDGSRAPWAKTDEVDKLKVIGENEE